MQDDGDPTTVSRPWDTGRDGFVLSEGAGVLVLESESTPRTRRRIYAEVLGAGITADAHDIAEPDPAARGSRRCWARWRRPTSTRPTSPTSTPTPPRRLQGDIAEGLMIGVALSEGRRRTSRHGTKSMTGHLLGRAGALESLATLLALHHRLAPRR